MSHNRFYPGAFTGKNNRFERNKRVAEIIENYHGRILKFRELPVNCQKAIIIYMALDGEAWHFDELEGITWFNNNTELGQLVDQHSLVQAAIKKYGDVRFGLVEVSVERLLTDQHKMLKQVADVSDTLDEYRKDLALYGESEDKFEENDWPAIFNSFETKAGKDLGGLFEDGNHRFTAYVFRKLEKIPCIWFPRN